MRAHKTPVKICKVGGRTFPIFREYDEQVKSYYLTYPDFAENPQCTAEGRPFARSDQSACRHYAAQNKEEPAAECGDCRHFFKESASPDPIGICMCDKLRRNEVDGGVTL